MPLWLPGLLARAGQGGWRGQDSAWTTVLDSRISLSSLAWQTVLGQSRRPPRMAQLGPGERQVGRGETKDSRISNLWAVVHRWPRTVSRHVERCRAAQDPGQPGGVGVAEPLARKLLPQAAWPTPNSKVKGVARGPHWGGQAQV